MKSPLFFYSEEKPTLIAGKWAAARKGNGNSSPLVSLHLSLSLPAMHASRAAELN
jgi:hypothetical protein